MSTIKIQKKKQKKSNEMHCCVIISTCFDIDRIFSLKILVKWVHLKNSKPDTSENVVKGF